MLNKLSALEVAKYFIWKANQEGKTITNKKLQKLLYYAQAWHLVFEKKPLFNENIEAWVHGPAISVVYDEYKKFGREPIREKIDDEDVKAVKGIDILGQVWTLYGKFDADYLEVLTHNETPWQEAREKLDDKTPSDAVISLDSMKEFYTKMYEAHSQ